MQICRRFAVIVSMAVLKKGGGRLVWAVPFRIASSFFYYAALQLLPLDFCLVL